MTKRRDTRHEDAGTSRPTDRHTDQAQAECPVCRKMVAVKAGKLASHGPGKDGAFFCRGSKSAPQ